MRTRAALLAATALVLTVGSAAGAAPAKRAPRTPTCFGKHATKVLKANAKTLTGTKKNDVLVATGKNDTVLGLGGNDLICVTRPGKKVDAGAGNDKVQVVAGVVKGGDGNDTIVQKGTGKVTIDAGKGKDTATLASPSAGSSLVGGPDPDAFSVPSAKLANVSIPVTSGDTLNGIDLSVDQPASGGPTFLLGVNGTTASATPIAVRVKSASSPIWADYEGVTNVDLNAVAYAPGRDPAAWTVDYGDGTPVDGGFGPPPQLLSHSYLTAGARTITATVSDDQGGVSHRTALVVAGPAATPEPHVSETHTGNQVTFTLHAPPTPLTSPVTSWVLEFGDGSADRTGTGSPDGTTFMHTYPAAGYYRTDLMIQSADGSRNNENTYLSLGPADSLSISLSGNGRVGTAARLLTPGQGLQIQAYDQGFDSYLLDKGDGAGPHPWSGDPVSYATPGTYPLKLTAVKKANAALNQTVTLPVTVSVPASRAQVGAPNYAAEGTVTWDLRGTTVAPGAHWFYTDPRTGDYQDVRGTGALPASLGFLLAARHGNGGMTDQVAYYLYLEITNGPLPLTDLTTLEYDISADATINVQPLRTTFDTLGLRYGYYGETRQALTTNDPSFSLITTSPVGVQVVSRTLTIDGVSHTLSGGSSSELTFGHALGIGEHKVIATVRDSAGSTARAVTQVSIAGPLSVTAGSATATAAHGTPLTIAGIAESVGASARAASWDVSYDDGTDPPTGYGTIPTQLTHTWTSAGTYTVRLSVHDDHGQTQSFDVTVTVT